MTTTVIRRAAVFALALSATAPAAGATPACRAESGPQTVALVELYTSEGCDSCPPADRWLSTTFVPGDVRSGAVAVAFHVDYWDRLGWKDRFAAAAWTKRQYDSARAARSELVYTPQVLLQGRDFRDWTNASRSAAAIAALGRLPARAALALDASPEPGAIAVKAVARVPATADRKGARVHVALVEHGLVSEVKAGENAGKRLSHDHVVRAVAAPIAVDASGEGAGTVVLPLPGEAGRAAEIVAFVQSAETGVVLQALALPLAGACVPPR